MADEVLAHGSMEQPRLKVSASPITVVLMILMLAGTGTLVYSTLEIRQEIALARELAVADWEYEVLTFAGVGYDRLESPESFYTDWITPSLESLNEMGRQGWELAGCYLEMETAFPNFGNEDYVTGIRDNIRPQRLVLIFKRRLP